MLLIDKVISAREQSICVSARANSNAWYVDANGDMPAWVGIELMAQSIAAWVGLQGWQQGKPPKKGFLLGTRNYTSQVPSFVAGSEIEITASETYQDEGGLGAFDCSLAINGLLVAEASLKVFEPADFDAFMEQQ